MELGALQCVPQRPDCSLCPLSARCLAYASGDVHSFPVKQNKTKTRDRYFHYFYIIYKGQTWLRRRSGKDIWNGLYEFPLIETAHAMDFAQLRETEAFRRLFADAGELAVSVGLSEIKHVLSHQVLYATFYKVEIDRPGKALADYLPIRQETIDNYAVPRLIQLYLESL